MRDSFIQYHINEYVNDILENAIIVLDANSLLNLYRYSRENREKYFEILDHLEERFILPYQVCQEFYENRITLIKNRSDFKKSIGEFIEDKFQKILNMIESGTNNQEYDKALAILRHEDNLKADIIHNIEKSKLDILEIISGFDGDITENYIYKSDPILDKINEIFEEKVNEKNSEEKLKDIYKQGEERYKENIPPGYKDSNKGFPNKFGDLVIWSEIIQISKRFENDILFVSDDRKEDWVDKHSGIDLGPRKELISEFYSKTGRLFYSINTKEFIKQMSRIHEVEDTDSLEKQTELIQDEIAGNKITSILSEQLKEIQSNVNAMGVSDFSKELQRLQSNVNAMGISDFSKELQKLQSNVDAMGVNDFSKELEGLQSSLGVMGISNILKQLKKYQKNPKNKGVYGE